MCKADEQRTMPSSVPPTKPMPPPSFLARYTCLGILLSIFAVWGKYTFIPEDQIPGVDFPLHSYRAPLTLTVFYLVSLPLLRLFTETFMRDVDAKLLLKESMVFYNVAQVLLNGWIVYRTIDALLYRGHPFIGDLTTVRTGATYAVWVHYCDKYLEFFDTYFMVLRGRMDQVSFLHIYHHVTIAWAWWAAMKLVPGGDVYFGSLFNSWIHVMMYSYYALALLKFPCPWKRFLTMAQLFQFCSVVVYTVVAMYLWGEQRTWKNMLASFIQLFEMISLFFLFMAFYKKSYKNKGNKSKSKKEKDEDGQDDQCQVAVATATATVSKAASAAYSVATKDASKLIETAKKTAPVTVKKNVDGMSRPSWSIIN